MEEKQNDKNLNNEKEDRIIISDNVVVKKVEQEDEKI